MLTHALAWIVGLGSLSLFGIAFIFPEIRRQEDRIWGGLGLFYALMLWVYGDRITPGLFLGQTACVALLFWLGAQTMQQRQALCPAEVERPDPKSLPGRIRAALSWLWERLSQWIAVGVDQVPKRVEQLLGLLKRQDAAANATGEAESTSLNPSEDPWETAETPEINQEPSPEPEPEAKPATVDTVPEPNPEQHEGGTSKTSPDPGVEETDDPPEGVESTAPAPAIESEPDLEREASDPKLSQPDPEPVSAGQAVEVSSTEQDKTDAAPQEATAPSADTPVSAAPEVWPPPDPLD
jgi:hypothetical protein